MTYTNKKLRIDFVTSTPLKKHTTSQDEGRYGVKIQLPYVTLTKKKETKTLLEYMSD